MPPGEAVVGVRVPRSRGAISIAKRSAVVVPVRRMVLASAPLPTRVVRIWTPGLLSLASLRSAKSPTARAPPRETAIQNFAHLLISGQIFESIFEASRPATHSVEWLRKLYDASVRPGVERFGSDGMKITHARRRLNQSGSGDRPEGGREMRGGGAWQSRSATLDAGDLTAHCCEELRVAASSRELVEQQLH